ncbi:hypothetical protein ABPG75_003879 [Micractinium tetrahymenae]
MASLAALSFPGRILAQQSSASKAHARRGVVVVQAAKAARGKKGLSDTGYIVDNSERGNIFAIMPKQLYTSSPTADRAARQGIGGTQGLILLAVVIGAVAVATLGVAGTTSDTLQSVAGQSAQDSLSAIAGRLSEGL